MIGDAELYPTCSIGQLVPYLGTAYTPQGAVEANGGPVNGDQLQEMVLGAQFPVIAPLQAPERPIPWLVCVGGMYPVGGVEGMIGEVRLWVNFMTTVGGWLPCNGSLLSVTQYADLFAVLGTAWGGDGQTTFGLPNLPSPGSGLSYHICFEGAIPTRDEDGYSPITYATASVTFMAANVVPVGFVPLQGQLVVIDRSDVNQMALFSLVGTSYGGDGQTTFGLPNLPTFNGLTCIMPVAGWFPLR